jgi:hypothetical protein
MFNNRSTPPTEIKISEHLATATKFARLIKIYDIDLTGLSNKDISGVQVDVKDIVLDKDSHLHRKRIHRSQHFVALLRLNLNERPGTDELLHHKPGAEDSRALLDKGDRARRINPALTNVLQHLELRFRTARSDTEELSTRERTKQTTVGVPLNEHSSEPRHINDSGLPPSTQYSLRSFVNRAAQNLNEASGLLIGYYTTT